MILLLGMRGELLALDHDRYWELVRRTVADVLQRPATAADELRLAIGQRPADEQLLFYHAEPLDVATSVARSRANETEVKRYLALRAEIYPDLAEENL